MATTGAPTTRDRILAAALDRFGTRGVDAVSLDDIAAVVGVRKQTVLYWFASKEELVDAVLEAAVSELAVVVDAAVRAAPDDPLERVDAVVRAVFRPAVRRPALLGLVRELSRLPGEQAERLRAHVDPLVRRAVAYLAAEMDAGRLRRADPSLVAALAYATVTGIATEPEALRGVGGSRRRTACGGSGPSCARSSAPRSLRDGRANARRCGMAAPPGAEAQGVWVGQKKCPGVPG